MDSEIIHFGSIAISMVLELSLPPIAVATVVGLLVSIFQTITQIQEQTLVYGVKLVAVSITIMFTVSWMGSELVTLMGQIFEMFPALTR